MSPPSNTTRSVRRKRKSSATGEHSSQDTQAGNDHSQAHDAPRRKRTKRVALSASQQLLAEDENASQGGSQPGAEQDSTITEDNITVVANAADHSKHVQFIEPGLAINVGKPHASTDLTNPEASQQAVDAVPAYSTDVGTTTNARDTSSSPIITTKPQRRSSKSFIPQTLQSSPNDDSVAELQFSPLREVLDERVRRRLRRSHLSEEMNDIDAHKKEDAKTKGELARLRQQIAEKNKRMEELEWDLEVQRQQAIDVSATSAEEDKQVKDMQDELKRLRQEVEEHQRENDRAMADTDHDLAMLDHTTEAEIDGDEDVTLLNPDDVGVPAITTVTKTTTFTKESTPVFISDPTKEVEVLEFERTTALLHEKLAAKRAALQILVTELQTLSFTDVDAGPDIIIAKIRAKFRALRVQLHELIPFVQWNKHNNGGLFDLMMETLRELVATESKQTEQIELKSQALRLAETRHANVLEQLADLEHRRTELASHFHKADMLADKRAKEIVAFEDQVQELTDSRDQLDRELTDLIAEHQISVVNLQHELKEADSARQALLHQVADLADQITLAEATRQQVHLEHTNRIAEIEQDRTAAELALRDELSAREAELLEAEQTVGDRDVDIAQLQAEARDYQEHIDILNARLGEHEKDTNKLQGQHAFLEQELESKTSFITELEGKLDALEDQVDGQQLEVEELRALGDSERRQREAAEQDLDQRNETVDALQHRLTDLGVEANELRSKLFEVQQRREVEVKELEANAAQQQAQLEADVTAERDSRIAAELRVEELDNAVADLESKILDVENWTNELLAASKVMLAEKEGDVRNLETSLAEHQAHHQLFEQEKVLEVDGLQGTIRELEATVQDISSKNDGLEKTIVKKTQAHENTLERMDEAMVQLNEELEEERDNAAELEKMRLTLEQRVESEATAMLEAQEKHDNVVTELKNSLTIRDMEIGKLVRKMEDDKQHLESIINERNEWVQELESLVERRDQDNQALREIEDDLRNKLVESIRLGREAASKTNAQVAAALEGSQQEEQKLFEAGEQLIQNASFILPQFDEQETGLAGPQRRSARVVEKRRLAKQSTVETFGDDSGISIGADSQEVV